MTQRLTYDQPVRVTAGGWRGAVGFVAKAGDPVVQVRLSTGSRELVEEIHVDDLEPVRFVDGRFVPVLAAVAGA